MSSVRVSDWAKEPQYEPHIMKLFILEIYCLLKLNLCMNCKIMKRNVTEAMLVLPELREPDNVPAVGFWSLEAAMDEI